MHYNQNKKMYNHEKMANMIMKNYEMYQLIGEGVSARVYRALDTNAYKEVAVKVIPKLYLNSDPKLMQLVKTQISILKSCNNYNVIKCYDVFQSANSIFIVTQLCNGYDLQKYLECRKYLTEDKAVMFLKQILNGFQGLHNLGVMHRDFKLANVLLNDDVCKIADLGFAKKMDRNQITYTLLGTKVTMAPQVLQGNGYSFSADIWSLGVVFYQMLYGKYPYMGINERDFLRKIKTKPIQFQSMRISNQARNFIERCLTYDHTKRITWYQIYSHPLINKQSMQLVYGIFNPVHRMQENQNFYQKNQKQFENPQNNFSVCQALSIMKSTVRKKIIMQQIQYILGSTRTTLGNSISSIAQQKQRQCILFNYANKYLMYYNKLSFPFKFLRLQLLQGTVIIQNNMQIQSFVYLIFKKCLCQLLEFLKVLNNKINIFKINVYWGDFIRSVYYRQVKETVQYNIKKAQKIIKQLQHYACFSSIVQIKEEATYSLLSYEEIRLLCQKYQLTVAKNLFYFFKNDTTKNSNFMEFMEGLMYYLISDQREKISPQDFDIIISQPFNNEQKHKDLIERFQLFFTTME